MPPSKKRRKTEKSKELPSELVRMTTTSGQDGRPGNFPVRAVLHDSRHVLFTPSSMDSFQNKLLETIEWLKTSPSARLEFGTNVDTVQTLTIARARLPLDVSVVQDLQTSDGQDVIGNICNRILPLLNTSDHSRYSADLTDPAEQAIFGLALFSDPPGSAQQEFHEDLIGFRFAPFWNCSIPLELPHEFSSGEFQNWWTTAESLYGGPKCAQNVHERTAVFWDAAWPHRGTGNRSVQQPGKNSYKVQLHLLFGPRWIFLDTSPSVLVNLLKAQCRGKTSAECLSIIESAWKLNPATFLDPIRRRWNLLQQYHALAEMAREYSGGLLGSRNAFFEHGCEFARAMFSLYIQGSGPYRHHDLFLRYTWREEKRHNRALQATLLESVRSATLARWNVYAGKVYDLHENLGRVELDSNGIPEFVRDIGGKYNFERVLPWYRVLASTRQKQYATLCPDTGRVVELLEETELGQLYRTNRLSCRL